MDIYKFAAQKKLRFPSNRGPSLLVENLFEMPLKSADGFDLDTVAKTIDNELKTKGEKSFVEDNSNDPRKKALEVSLEIVIDVIKTKQEANAARLARADRAAKREKILDALAEKEGQALATASVDDLKKQLAELDVE